MIHYDDYNLQLIERAIRRYNNQGDYWRAKGLLENILEFAYFKKKSSIFAAFLERNPKTRRRTLTQLRTNEIWKISSKGGSNCFLRIYAEYLSVYVAWSSLWDSSFLLKFSSWGGYSFGSEM